MSTWDLTGEAVDVTYTPKAGGYVAMTMVICLLAGVGGLALAKWLKAE